MSAAGTEILRAEGICKSYDGRAIIRDVSLRLDQGELVCLLGVSGAGKTTLFHALSGLEQPEAGRVLLSGEDITGRPGKISYMLQKDLLLPHKKVADNVALPLVLRGEKPKAAREKALEAAIRAMLGIGPKVHLVAPKSITRSEGKAVRVIDKRKLHD